MRRRSRDYDERCEAQEDPAGKIAQAVAGQAEDEAENAGETDQERPDEDFEIAAAMREAACGVRLSAAVGRERHHARAFLKPPLAISSIRRSSAPGRRRSHSITPVHSTQIVAQTILSGSPP